MKTSWAQNELPDLDMESESPITSLSCQIPNGWRVVRFGQIADFRNGVNFSARDRGSGTKIIGVADFQDRATLTREEIAALPEVGPVDASSLLQPGDILFVRSNGNRSLIGRSLVLEEVEGLVTHSGFTIRARLTDPELVPTYLGGLVLIPSFRRMVFKRGSGTNISNLNQGILASAELLLPPLEEQVRIRETLDVTAEVVRQTDTLIDAKLRQKRALAERLLTHLNGRPTNWPVGRLEAVAQIRTGLAKGKSNRQDSVRLPFLAVSNVQDGFLDLRNVKEIEVARGEIDRYRLLWGDVLLTEGGDPDKLGRGYIWRGQIDPCLHQNHVFVVRADLTRLDPRFLSIYVGSARGKRYFAGCAKQTTNLATINSSQLRAMPLPVPSLSEQRSIADTLDAADEEIALLRRQLELLKRQKQGLMQQLLTGRLRLPEFRG